MDLNNKRETFSSKPDPAPVVSPETNEVTPPSTHSSTRSRNADAFQPVPRSNRGTTQPTSTAPKVNSDSVNTANLSGIAATAAKYVGVPYVWGGNTPSGWDCSGFVKYVYAQHGINIARGTSAIRGSGQFVRTSSPKPGDLVFQNGGGHVGIYLGGGKMIGAQNPTVDTILHDVSRNPLYGYYTLMGYAQAFRGPRAFRKDRRGPRQLIPPTNPTNGGASGTAGAARGARCPRERPKRPSRGVPRANFRWIF
jgi:cell wall-associated NlpC family hydrolase